MKKLFYVLTLVLLLAVVPVSTVEAKTTKPDKPTIEVKYSTSKDQWYARFDCKTKGVTIKYRIHGNYKSIKPGKWFKINNGNKYQAYSVKGKAKSKVCKYDTTKYAEAKRSADMHKVVDEKTGKTAVQILFDDVAPKFKDVNGGYTTILKTYNRKGDNAPMAILSLTK